MGEHAESRPAPEKRRLGPFVIILIVLLGAAGAFFLLKDRLGGGNESKLRLTAAKNVALGELENEVLDKAIELLTQIAEEAPSDPFGPRNLAVARLLDLEKQQKGDEEAFARKQADAEQAVQKLLSLEGQAGYAHWIMSRIQKAAQNEAGQFESLQQAADLMPDQVALWHEIYMTGRASSEEPRRKQAQQALAKAYSLAPDNYAVMIDWMTAQAADKDPAIVKTLQAARQTLTPLAEVVQLRVGVDIMQMIDRAIEMAQSGDWRKAESTVRQIGNVVRPDESQLSDVRRLEAHPLAFIVLDFAPSFYEGWKPELKPPLAEKLRLESSPLEGLPAEAKQVSDVRITDFDLDGKPDLVLCRPGAAEAYRRADDGAWTLIARCDLPEGLTRVFPADLYRTEETGRPTKKFVTEESPAPADGQATPTTAAEQPGAAEQAGATEQAADQPGASGEGGGPLLQKEPPPNPGCQDTFQGLIAYGESGLRILKFDPINQPQDQQLSIVDQTDDLENLPQVSRVAPIDFDNDGDLDLAVLSQGKISLWLNRSDSTFSPASEWSKLPDDALRFTDLAVTDLERDVDLDILLVAPESNVVGYLENLRHGQFRWRELEESHYAPLRGAAAVAAAELDGNASWDLIVAGEKGLAASLTRTPSIGVVTAKDNWRLEGAWPGAQLMIWDYNNDAFLDALVLSQGKLSLFSGSSDAANGKFAPSSALNEPPADVAAFDIGDLDQDGDLDIVAAAAGGLAVLTNQGGDKNHWMFVRARGQYDNVTGRANHYGIGSLIELRTKTRYQAQIIDRQTTHFGLGQESPADALRLVWTTGIPQARTEPSQDHRFCEPMVLKGSCPYLYTWTGRRYEFFTDLLWAAPLGLQLAEGKLAPCRPWEYLKIPGDRLALKDGAYELKITAELWEADYFDKVQLIAIDHPADVQIESNEKVGPAEIAQFQVHTVQRRKSPLAARDKQGADVLPLVLAADNQFMTGFTRKLRQGLTEEHFLELDLGDFQTEDKVTLFLTGWIRPTDTSINVALSQDPTLEAPRPAYLMAPDAKGQWVEIRPYMGFPGGKTKTIAVDLTGAFPTSDHRLRIVTSQELYWDEAFFTVGESPAPTRVTPLELLSADLRYRGFSQVRIERPDLPETFDYESVDARAKWPPMDGEFTRYGDVKTLLTDEDSRLLVMSSGDEATLRFAPPDQPPPQGWTRDFFLYSFGWDKDADLNTVFGQTVAPMPFAEMRSYPYVEQEYPDTPELREYMKEFQTRRVDPGAYWKQLLQAP